MTGDSGDVINSLGAWALWRAIQLGFNFQLWFDTCLEALCGLLGIRFDSLPRFDVKELL